MNATIPGARTQQTSQTMKNKNTTREKTKTKTKTKTKNKTKQTTGVQKNLMQEYQKGKAARRTAYAEELQITVEERYTLRRNR